MVGRGVPAEPSVGGASVLASRLQPVTSDLPPKLLASTATTTNRGIQLAPSPLWGEGRGEVLLAHTGQRRSRAAVVFDYTTVTCSGGTCNGYRFAPNETYYISSPIQINNNAVFCGGTVIKIAPWLSGPSITINGTPYFDTGPGRMVLITGRDDDSVGQHISSSTLSVAYGYPALYFSPNSAPANIEYLRISWAPQSIYFQNVGPNKIRHSQFVNGWSGIVCEDNNLTVHNVLFASVDTPFEGYYFNIHGQQVTVHRAFMLASDWLEDGLQRLTLTNSIIVEAGACSPSTCFTPSPTVWLAPENYPFQTSGLGGYYLPQSSVYHGIGDPSIDGQLRNDLKRKTTYVPTALPATISATTVLAPTVPRNDGINPDLGFSYDAIDFIGGGVQVQTGTLLLTNGVTVTLDAGASSTGLTVGPGTELASQGSPTALNRLIEIRSVQEQPGAAVSVFAMIHQQANTSASHLRLRFTEFIGRANLTWHIQRDNGLGSMALTDCQVFDSAIGGSPTWSQEHTIGLTNSLFDHAGLTIVGTAHTHFDAFNNTFTNCNISLSGGSFAWAVRDNLFLSCSLGASPPPGNSHNGYWNTTYPLSGSGPDYPLTAQPNYASGPLGHWYLAEGSSQLLNGGSRLPGDAGLFHHTTRTSQVKEGNKSPAANVDVGFHYVAVETQNLAPHKYATQSTTETGHPADLAIDGNTSGSGPSVARISNASEQWWQIDLGFPEQISTVTIWNRTDCCATALQNFYVLVSDDPFQNTQLNSTLAQSGVSSYYVAGLEDVSKSVAINRSGQFLRIQLKS